MADRWTRHTGLPAHLRRDRHALAALELLSPQLRFLPLPRLPAQAAGGASLAQIQYNTIVAACKERTMLYVIICEPASGTSVAATMHEDPRK